MVKLRNMGMTLASRNLFLHLLILLIARGVQSRKVIGEENPNNILQLPSSNNNIVPKPKSHDHTSTHHMDDTNVKVFFTMKDLKQGKTMPIYFPKEKNISPPKFLPRHEADSIPFSSQNLPYLLKFFSFSPESPQGTAMADTLRSCETSPIKGETKTCVTSLESMLDFVEEALGSTSEGQISAVSTSYSTNSTTSFQNYTVLEAPEEVLARKMVACHTMPYPYAVFYCHTQESENRVFKAVLGGEDGDVVEAVAVCHLDTSQWSRKHVSFRVLGIEPGTLPVCHFFPPEHLVWIKSTPSV